jgi:hypothetical protein
VVEGDEVAYIREATGFPGVAMILRVESEVKKSGVVTGLEARHFITSLGADEASPKRLLGLVRGHWGVENGLHFLKDRWWDEDRQWSVRPGLAESLAALRDGALAALRLIPGLPDDLPIRARADHLSRKPRKALKCIGALK